MDLDPRPQHARIDELSFPEIGEYPTEFADSVRRLAELREWAISFVAALVRDGRELTTGLVHGDLFPGNLLVENGRAKALLDFEEAHVGWQAFDVAHAMWDFSLDAAGTGLHRSGAERFMSVYRAAGGTVPPEEDDLLVPFVRVKRILEVLRAPTDREVDWGYQRRNMLAADRLT